MLSPNSGTPSSSAFAKTAPPSPPPPEAMEFPTAAQSRSPGGVCGGWEGLVTGVSESSTQTDPRYQPCRK